MSEAATGGDGWIACGERLPEKDGVTVEVRMKAHLRTNKEWWVYGEHTVTHWRPLPVDPHAVAACLFGKDRPTLAQARAATLHVAGCAECRAKLEAKAVTTTSSGGLSDEAFRDAAIIAIYAAELRRRSGAEAAQWACREADFLLAERNRRRDERKKGGV